MRVLLQGGCSGIPSKDPWIKNRRHVKEYPHVKSVHIRRSTLKRLSRVCATCGEVDESKLVVDHINGNSLDNRLGNFQVLCRKCPAKKIPDSPYIALLKYDAKWQG